MKKKISTFLVSLSGSILFYLLFVSKTVQICDIYCDSFLGHYHRTLLIFPFILLFSALTFFLPHPIFKSWFKYTLIVAPIIIAIVFTINLGLHHTHGGWFNTSNIFDWPTQALLYSLYCLGSVTVIVRGYWLAKRVG